MKIGFALTGSFCTFDKAKAAIRELVASGHDVTPIMSEISFSTDTRFGTAQSHIDDLKEICSGEIIHTILQAEPVGPKKMFDIIVVAPCTGNTLAKLNLGIVDTSVAMACKSHLRNARPLVLAVSTKDALGNAAKNIGGLLNYRNIYFVPMKQDNPAGKPRSVVALFEDIPDTIEAAIKGEQIQPIYK
jgi:dipicolinate synthase subunit B